jgi:hypothetical protein
MSEKYNGWTNYETWNAKLWIDNDQGSKSYWQEQAQDAYNNADADGGDGGFTRKENAACDLRERLKSEFEEVAANLLEGNDKTGDMTASWCADFLNAAISEANWHEIAESLLGDIEEEDEETAEAQ